MRRFYIVGIAFLCVSANIWMSSCKSPEEEVNITENAIQEAKLAGAEIYASAAFHDLQVSYQAIVDTIYLKRPRLIKNFSNEKDRLSVLQVQAQKVKEETEKRKEEVKEEVQGQMAEVENLVMACKLLIRDLPQPKGSTTLHDGISEKLTEIESTLKESEGLFNKGDFMTCKIKAQIAKNQVSELHMELNNRIAQLQSNGKSKRG